MNPLDATALVPVPLTSDLLSPQGLEGPQDTQERWVCQDPPGPRDRPGPPGPPPPPAPASLSPISVSVDPPWNSETFWFIKSCFIQILVHPGVIQCSYNILITYLNNISISYKVMNTIGAESCSDQSAAFILSGKCYFFR